MFSSFQLEHLQSELGVSLETLRLDAASRTDPWSFAFRAIREPAPAGATTLTPRALLAVVTVRPEAISGFRAIAGIPDEAWSAAPWAEIDLLQCLAESVKADSLVAFGTGPEKARWSALAGIAATPRSIWLLEMFFFPSQIRGSSKAPTLDVLRQRALESPKGIFASVAGAASAVAVCITDPAWLLEIAAIPNVVEIEPTTSSFWKYVSISDLSGLGRRLGKTVAEKLSDEAGRPLAILWVATTPEQIGRLERALGLPVGSFAAKV